MFYFCICINGIFYRLYSFQNNSRLNFWRISKGKDIVTVEPTMQQFFGELWGIFETDIVLSGLDHTFLMI
jgi:hypothetical protein